MKLLKKFIIKRIVNRHCDYHLYRWLIKRYVSRYDTAFVLRKIALTFDANEILTLTDLFVVDDVVYLKTFRPGIWIGKGGKTMDLLIDTISADKKFKLEIIEDTNCPVALIGNFLSSL